MQPSDKYFFTKTEKIFSCGNGARRGAFFPQKKNGKTRRKQKNGRPAKQVAGRPLYLKSYSETGTPQGWQGTPSAAASCATAA